MTAGASSRKRIFPVQRIGDLSPERAPLPVGERGFALRRVADGRLVVGLLLVATDAIGDAFPGRRRVVERLLGALSTAHRRRQVLVENIPILESAWDAQISQHRR